MATPEKKEEPSKVTPLLELPRCSKATAPPDPDDYGPIVTVVVGSKGKTRKFYAYKGLLIHYSSYFRAALKDHWQEGTSKVVGLTNDNPEVFRAFFHWINTGKLYFALNVKGEVPLTLRLICEVYVFGDARGVPGLCNAAIDLLFQKIQQEWKFPFCELAYVYDNTLFGSALRRCLVADLAETHRFAMLSDPIQREVELPKYPKEFLADILVAFMALGSRPIPSSTFNKINWANSMKDMLCPKYHDHSPPST